MRPSRLAWPMLALILSWGHVVVSAEAGIASASGSGAKLDRDIRAVLAASAPHEMVAVIVTLRDQADLEGITAATRGSRLRAVVRALQREAVATQDPLVALLEAGFATGEVVEVTPFWVFNGLAVTATPGVIREVAARPEVQLITPDRTIELRAGTAAGSPEPNVALVEAPALWDLGYRGQGVVVATMDTGVDATHPDLAGRWRGGTNSWFDPNGQHATPFDASGHGTWTMGVLVGGDAGGTSVGVAPDAQWISVKIFDDRGVATTAGIHQGFQWLLDPDGYPATADAPHVVSNSWTMGSIGCNLEFQLDLRSLWAAGILPIFAAGNFGRDTATSASPANNPEAFAVGATDDADVLYPGSSRGPSSCGEPETIFPELVAPGVRIRTTDLFGFYTRKTGTSLAAPHVAGALALLLDASPDLPADIQEDALENGAVDLGASGPDNGYGYGRLDILESYRWLAAQFDFALTVAPESAVTVPGGEVSFTVTVSPVNGFTGDVGLSLGGLSSSEASWSFTPETIAGGSGSSQFMVTTAASLAPGTYPLTITGTSGSLLRSAPATLVVNPPSDFGLSVSPASRTVKPGRSTSYTVSIWSRGGFADTVDLSVTGLPSGARAKLRPGSVAAPGSSKMTVRTTHRVERGTFTLTVVGQSGSTVHESSTRLIVRRGSARRV